jgi:hypothetical protein
MGFSFNPFTLNFDITGDPSTWQAPVPNEAALPSSGNTDGDVRVTIDTDTIYVWNNTSSLWVNTKLKSAAVGSSPNANGHSLVTTDNGTIQSTAITLQPADATNPGVVTTGSQSIAGSKAFSGLLKADGGIDLSSAGTLSIGVTTATAVNIGSPSATVNIQGTINNITSTNTNITDALITLNKGGSASSAAGSGIEFEEASSITGYVKVSPDRNGVDLKAPNQAGVASIQPGSGGITLNQSSHDPVTLNAVGSSPNANAASLSTQSLTLQPADGSYPGLITAGAQTIGGNKTFNGSISASNLSGSNTGDVSLAAVGSSPNANGASLSGQTLNLEPADATNPGVVTTGAQTFAGTKTFSSTISGNISGSAATFTGSLSGDVTGGQSTTAIADSVVTGKLITGFVSGAGTVSATDTVLQAIDKLDGNVGTKLDSSAFTDTAVTGKLLTGYTSGAGTVAATDTILQGINKLNGNAVNIKTTADAALPSASFTDAAVTGKLLTGFSSGSGTVSATDTILQGINKLDGNVGTKLDSSAFTDSAVTSKLITGFSSGAGTVSASDTILQAINKLDGNVGTKVSSVSGDIIPTSFSAANNQAVAADVTGLAFANGAIRSAEVQYSVVVSATSSLYEAGTLRLIQKGAGWDMANVSVGDVSGFVFSVTSSGQVQYTNLNYAGFSSAVVKFRATILPV